MSLTSNITTDTPYSVDIKDSILTFLHTKINRNAEK